MKDKLKKWLGITEDIKSLRDEIFTKDVKMDLSGYMHYWMTWDYEKPKPLEQELEELIDKVDLLYKKLGYETKREKKDEMVIIKKRKKA